MAAARGQVAAILAKIAQSKTKNLTNFQLEESVLTKINKIIST
jgi:hypothetical protein